MLTGLVNHYLQVLTSEFIVISTTQSVDLNMNNPSIIKIVATLDIILMWTRIHESVFERYESKKDFGLQQFAISEEYSQAFKCLLGIYVPTSNQPNSNILSVTGIEKLDNLINNIKYKCLECINVLYRYMVEKMHPNLRA